MLFARAFIAVFVFLLVLSSSALGQGSEKATSQAEPFNLSGTWILDRSKSDFGALSDSPLVQAEVTLTIEHAAPELKIKRKETRDGREQLTELAYYTDGRGEMNPSTLGRVGVKTSTKWDGGKIVSTSKLTRRDASGKTSTLETTDRWQLSKDGRTLTQVTAISYGGGKQTVKQVYRKSG